MAKGTLGGVWVLSLSLELVGSMKVIVSPVVPSTVAAKVSLLSGAVNELLLRKERQGTGLDAGGRLKSTSSGKGPA